MRVLIDAGCLAWQRTTGWERYTRTVVEALRAYPIPDLDVDILTPPPGTARGMWEQVLLPRAVRNLDAVLHCPATPPSPAIRVRCVTTVHDATLFFHPDWGSRVGRHVYRRFLLRQRGNRLFSQLTPSFASRHDLALAGFSLDRITVASPPPSIPEAEPRRVAGVTERFVLFVGTREPRKNIDLLLKAWAQVRVGGGVKATYAQLVIVGRRGWGRDLDAHLSGVVQLGSVSDSELVWLYRNACAVVSPSWYEGFGLPLVEALAHGASVIATDIPASREVGGAAATFVHPGDAQGLADRIRGVLERGDDSTTRNARVRTAHRFTLKGFAEALGDGYRSAAAA